MGISVIVVIDSSGVPISSYPILSGGTTTLMSGVLTSFVSALEQLGMGEVKKIEVGEQTYLVRKSRGFLLLFIVDNYNFLTEWVLKLVSDEIERQFNFEEIGNLSDSEIEKINNIISEYYNAFKDLERSYLNARDYYQKVKQLLGVKALELFNSALAPDIVLKDINGTLEIEDVKLRDLEKFKLYLERAVEEVKRNIKEML